MLRTDAKYQIYFALSDSKCGSIWTGSQRQAWLSARTRFTFFYTIEVRTEQPIPAAPRSSSPVIVLNGERLHDTWVILPNTLVAIVPDRSALKDDNQVFAEWLGNAVATRSRKPLLFRRADIPR